MEEALFLMVSSSEEEEEIGLRKLHLESGNDWCILAPFYKAFRGYTGHSVVTSRLIIGGYPNKIIGHMPPYSSSRSLTAASSNNLS